MLEGAGKGKKRQLMNNPNGKNPKRIIICELITLVESLQL